MQGEEREKRDQGGGAKASTSQPPKQTSVPTPKSGKKLDAGLAATKIAAHKQPGSAAEVFTCAAGDNSETMSLTRSKVSLAQVGVESIRTRRAFTGVLVSEILGASDKKADKLVSSLRMVCTEGRESHLRVPQRQQRSEFAALMNWSALMSWRGRRPGQVNARRTTLKLIASQKLLTSLGPLSLRALWLRPTNWPRRAHFRWIGVGGQLSCYQLTPCNASVATRAATFRPRARRQQNVAHSATDVARRAIR